MTYPIIDNNTKLIGIVGHPIKHSLSPLMQNISFALGKLSYIYVPFDVPSNNLEDAIKGMLALGIRGFNITLPHKEKIIQYLEDVSEEAGVIGAVNTVVNENGYLHGYNTDSHGITKSLQPYKEELNGAIVTVIGSGGAARSVVYNLIRHHKIKSMNIINRTLQRAEFLRDYFSSKMHFNNITPLELVSPDLVDVFKNSKLIVNTTSLGMYPNVDDSPVDFPDSFHEGQIVFDVVYNPLKTKFLQLAESRGAKIINGLQMFIEQGAKSFELWTGEEMNVGEIYEKLTAQLNQ